MAASVPPQKAPPGWTASPSSQTGSNTNALEIGMTGMSLESTWSGASRPPALSGSSVSTSIVDNSEQFMGITPPSPASPFEPGVGQSAAPQGSAKPPGFGVSHPSPIGKSSTTTSNTNVSSPHLSLTPPSSIDGDIDLYNMGKQLSQYFEGSSLPTPPNLDQSGESARNQSRQGGDTHITQAEKDGRRESLSENKGLLPGNFVENNNESLSSRFGGGLFSTGSFDPADHDDGLRGLGALRDRSQSSPGPFVSSSGYGSGPYSSSSSSSPVLYRESSPVYGESSVGSREEYPGTRAMPPDPRRARTISRDNGGKSSSRPPLSRGGTSTGFVQSQDVGGPSYGNSQTDRSFTSGPTSQQHGLGSIARPDLRYSTSDFVSDTMNGSRGRSMSLGASSFNGEQSRTLRDPYSESYQQQMEQLHAQKFASPHSLNAHIHQQRMAPHIHHTQQMPPHPQSLHVRSFSQPGPLQHAGSSGYSHGHEDATRYGLNQHQNGGEHRRNHSGGNQQRHLFEGESTSSLDGSRYGHVPHISRSVSAGANLTRGGGGLIGRKGNVSQPSLPVSSYDGHSHGKSSFHAHVSQNNVIGGTAMFSGHGGHAGQVRQQQVSNGYAGSQRVDSSEFQGGRVSRYDDSGVPVMATPEEMGVHGIGGHDGDRHVSSSMRHERLVSPSHSPLNMTIGGHPGHMRHYSDGTNMSASPISVGSMRGGQTGSFEQNSNARLRHHGHAGTHYQRSSSFDDDLTHPLVGEHIDDPEDDVGAHVNHGMSSGVAHHGSMPTSYGGDGAAVHDPHMGLRPSSALDQMSPASVATHYSTMDSLHHHHHSSASASSRPKAVYNIKFKRTQRCFIAGQRITRDLKIGCYVKVEADRGEDLGIVVSKVTAEKFNATGRSGFRGGVGSNSTGELTAGAVSPTAGAGSAGAADLKRVIRLATHDEVNLLAVKREEEEELLKICRTKVRQRGLPMHVVDAEYQFDRHKLTFFFEAEGRIDFRELVRDLFSMYKTRIWMQQLDKNSSGSAVAGVVTPSSGSLEGGNPTMTMRDEAPESDAMIVR